MQLVSAAARRHPPRRHRIAAALALSLGGAAAAAAEVELVSHDVPSMLEAATRQIVELELRNTGVDGWDPAAGFLVSYHWRDSAGEVVVWDGVRSELPAPVAPGEQVRLEAVLEVPRRSGELQLQWDVVHEGVRWLATSPDRPRPVTVEVRAGWAFSLTRSPRPRWLTAGHGRQLRVVIRNEGVRTWPADGLTSLSYHWFDGDGEAVLWDGARTPLPTAVEPGGEITLEAVLEPPRAAGRYLLQWDMVREGVAWFSERDPSPPPPRTVLVIDPLTASPAAWALASLVLAVAVVGLSRRGPAGLLGGVAVADVLWCAGAILVKEQAVLQAAGSPASLRTAVLTLGGVALALLPTLLLPRRVRVWCSWIIAALATLLLFADMVYARFFDDLLSVAVVGAASQVPDVRASLASLVRPADAWLWIDLAAGAVIAAAVARIPAGAGRRGRAAVALALAGAALVAGVWAGLAVRAGEIRIGQVFRNLALAREVGVLNFHALDVGRRLASAISTPRLGEERLDELAAWFEERAPLRAGAGPWFGAAEGHNLLMVQAESLQGFVPGLEVNGRPVTPFLDRWLEGAVRFSSTTDQTAQGRSSDAELLTQASLLPPAVGAAAFLFADRHFTGLASVLGDHGYATVSAVAYEGTFWNRRLTHRAYGFQTSLFDDSFEEGEVLGWGLNDRDFFQQMVGRLAAGPEPFAALLLTLSLHHPFAGFPERLKELDVGPLEGSPLGSYLHTMRFFDRAFAALVEELERSGLAGRTVVVLWGDHDAGLEWTPRLASMTGQPPSDAGWYLSQTVPLAIHVPGDPGPRGVLDLPAGHQDVAPTVLALLGIDPAVLPYLGRNLLGEPGDGPVVGEYHCWRTATQLFLQGDGTLEGGRCYRLPGLEPLDPAACAAGFADAQRQVEASQLVLEHDLQQELAARLAAAGEAAP